MLTRNYWLYTSCWFPLLVLWFMSPQAATAALLDLPQIPLTSGTGVEPNIMLIFDNSGSMKQERIITKVAIQSGGADSADSNAPVSVGGQDCIKGDPVAQAEEEGEEGGPPPVLGPQCGTSAGTADDWYELTIEFNILAYDPTRTYEPWIGRDNNGQTFQNQIITAARKNPYDTSAGTKDLSGETYYAWSDADSNGTFDAVEGTLYNVSDLDAAGQINYANWYSYYRTREYTAKAAYGKVIAQTTGVRMGLMTIHNEASYRVPIASLNTDHTTGHKAALLDTLYSVTSQGWTPLRSALYKAGQYLECVPGNGISDTCPVLPANAGGTCQQHFTVLMTDGEYNQTPPSVGNTDGPGSGNTAFDGGAYADGWSDTLADIAMHFYERDLHPTLANNVPILVGVDEAAHQHMVSYMVAFGLTGTLNGPPNDPAAPFTWPQPDGRGRIDDLIHAAYNGRGAFVTAFSAEQLVAALQAALQRATAHTGSAAAVAANGGNLTTDSNLYQIRYQTADWSGQLLSIPLTDDGEPQAQAWDAGALLDTHQASDPQHFDTGREIITYDDVAGAGIPFRWASLSAAMQQSLDLSAAGTADGQGADRLNYIRGDKSHEGTGNGYRARAHLLGDTVHAAPYYVAAPPFLDSVGAGYNSFWQTHVNRTPMLYLGANDGMLHAFDAATGQERFAYVPHAVFAHLNQLTTPTYGHRFFVDGSPTVLDAYANFGALRCGAGATCWRSVLVSGLRRGGQGVFALDVTDPSRFDEVHAAKLALWEFTDQDDADLGYTYSQPSIVRMANGRWAAVFGNGYNNSEADGNASTTGHAVLYIVYFDGGLDGLWTPGTDYIKLSTGSGTVTTPNGLATPAPVDVDGDMTVDVIYAGDLLGQLWKFDVNNADPAQWQVAGNQPLFIAEIGGNRQPITVRPEAGLNPYDPDDVLVYVGTGKYLEPTDHTTTIPTQTLYAIRDKVSTTPSTINRVDLLEQEVIATLGNARVTSDYEINWNLHAGWYLDLPEAGERHMSRPMLRNERVIFTTGLPHDQPCETGGSGWLMEFDAVTGQRLPHSPFDRDGDGDIDDDDLVTVNINGEDTDIAISGIASTEGILSSSTILYALKIENKYNSGSTGGVMTTTEHPGRRSFGRQAWRTLP